MNKQSLKGLGGVMLGCSYCLLAAGAVAAQPADERARARAHVEEGITAQKAGKYQEAIRLFNLAYELAPHPAILFNLGHAHRLLGEKAMAHSYYRKCVLAADKGPLAEEAGRWATLLEPELPAEGERVAEPRPREVAQTKEPESQLAATDLPSVRMPAVVAQLRAGERPSSSSRPRSPRGPAANLGVIEDAGSTSSLLMPTALVPPRGTLTLHNHDLLIAGASYVPLDRVMVSATVAPAVIDEGFVSALSVKLHVLGREGLRVALHASLLVDQAGEPSWGGTVGGVTTACITIRCSSHLGVYFGFGRAFGARTTMVGTSATVQIVRRLKLLAELDAGSFTREALERRDGLLLWYGLRLTWPTLGFDVGMVKPFVRQFGFMDNRTESTLGYPAVSLTYRVRRGS